MFSHPGIQSHPGKCNSATSSPLGGFGVAGSLPFVLGLLSSLPLCIELDFILWEALVTGLAEALHKARKLIDSHKGPRGLNEENTKGALIEPVLRALGWNVEDPEEVTREYKGKKRDRPVDYALRLLRSPRLFVEAKALGSDLSDRKWAGQIIGYASVAGVKWAVLTDGNEYRIYNTHAPVDVEKKLFRKISVTETTETDLIDTLRLLSRDLLEENRIEALWSIHFVDQQVRSTLEGLFGSEPDPALIRLVKKHTSGLSQKEVTASLGRLRIDLDFPAVVPPSTPKGPKEGGTSTPPSPPNVTLQELIAGGAFKPPLDIEKKYQGTTLRARIEGD